VSHFYRKMVIAQVDRYNIMQLESKLRYARVAVLKTKVMTCF